MAKQTTTTNATKTNEVFSLRHKDSAYAQKLQSLGLKQLTTTSHDTTQLILKGKTSINLRKRECFLNATQFDYDLCMKAKVDGLKCVENGNIVDGVRPHKVYFPLAQFDKVAQLLTSNPENMHGADIIL